MLHEVLENLFNGSNFQITKKQQHLCKEQAFSEELFVILTYAQIFIC